MAEAVDNVATIAASHEARIDALPYIDEEYDKYETTVAALIADEGRRFLPRNYLASRPEPQLRFTSEALIEAYGRAATKTRIALEMSRQDVPGPKRTADPTAWQEALHNAQAQLEHQYLRLANLELAESYGGNAWRVHNKALEHTVHRLESELQQLRQSIEQVNIARKAEQSAAATTLRELATEHADLLRRNADIEQEIGRLISS